MQRKSCVSGAVCSERSFDETHSLNGKSVPPKKAPLQATSIHTRIMTFEKDKHLLTKTTASLNSIPIRLPLRYLCGPAGQKVPCIVLQV